MYITGDKAGWETQIANDATDYITEHLDKIGVVPKISLFLFTNGGNTLAGWNIVNLIRQFCDDFEIIVPNKARSTGTLMCLGANRIIMTKQATLGPIDPSVNTPLNPTVMGKETSKNYSIKRTLVESLYGGTDSFVSEGRFIRVSIPAMPQNPVPQIAIQDQRIFEGWKHYE